MSSHLGEIAALATAACWTVTALAFAAAGRHVGSLVVNLVRLVLAALLLSLYTWVTRGQLLPSDASGHAWLWLSVSGVIGFAFGDLCLFRAFVTIGPRLAMLLMTLVPPITALLGWLVLGETLGWFQVLAMVLTITGVAWVVAERAPASAGAAPARPPLSGVLLGLGGAAGQAAGLVLSKYGMGDYDAFAATHIRVLAGAAAFMVLFSVIGWWPRVAAGMRHRRGMVLTSLGAVFGPFLGVSLSLVAVKYTASGVAATLMALVPILIIPPAAVLLGERVTARAVVGALVAVAGSVLLFW